MGEQHRLGVPEREAKRCSLIKGYSSAPECMYARVCRCLCNQGVLPCHSAPGAQCIHLHAWAYKGQRGETAIT